jgi:hypothetical protein
MMPTTTVVDELQHRLTALMGCVNSLRATQGDTPAARRLLTDVHAIRLGIERLQIDAEELRLSSAVVPFTRALPMIQISDADYDVDFWKDVDHEGVGTQGLAC